MENNKASVMPEYCTTCGICVASCSSEAKQVRSDLNLVRSLVNSNTRVIASIAPSFVSEFPFLSNSQLIMALKMLGFDAVSETALGAQMVSHQCAQYIQAHPNQIHLSSACPSVVELVRKHYPQHLSKITPLMSPLMAHAKMLKKRFGEEVSIVFIGPCIAKKIESDSYGEWVSAAITFKELQNWFDKEGLSLEDIPQTLETMVPYTAKEGALYPIDGGMIEGIRQSASLSETAYMTFSGQDNLHDILSELDQWEVLEESVFFELLACRGGCINGPGMNNQGAIGIKRQRVIKESSYPQAAQQEEVRNDWNIDLQLHFQPIERAEVPRISEKQMQDALASIGKIHDKDLLNCSGCGYETCKHFAKAMLESKAEPAMCVSFMRRMAQDKASLLLQKIPAAVVVVNEHMEIIEANKRFASMLGEEVELIFEAKPRLQGMDLRKIFPESKTFEILLQTGGETIERELRIDTELFHLSVFSIQKSKLACGIILNLHDPIVRQDFVKNKTEEVIHKHMETVQKIAALLGENASYTNSLLNSIVESLDKSKQDKKHS